MKRRFVAAVLALLAAVYLMPVALTVANSFMGQRELSELYVGSFPRLRLIPRQATLDGYFELLFAGGKYLQMFWQSAAIAGGISAGGILVSLFVGFALAQVPMRGKGVLRFTYTLMMMMPFQVTLLPNYIMIRQMGLFNTQWALILPGIFAPLGAFLVSQFMGSMPGEVLEAASLETNSVLLTTLYLIAPLSRPALTAQFLLSFAEAWNMVEQPLVLLEDSWKYPLSLALNGVSNEQTLVVFSGAVLYLLPIVFLYKTFEEALLLGISASPWEVKA